MVTIALYNIKGGVGKTAGSVNLAYLAAGENKRVLIWDLDPQGAASFYFKTEAKLKQPIKKLLHGDAAVDQFIVPTEFDNLWLLPADISNRNLDITLDETKQTKKKFRTLLANLEQHFDYLFIDCPPGIGLLSETIFSIANLILLPTIPTTLSIRSLNMVNEFLGKQPDAPPVFAYFNMVDVRKNMHSEIISQFQRNRQVLKSYIPYLSVVEKMGIHLAPLGHFAPSSYAAQCYEALWKEIKRKIHH